MKKQNLILIMTLAIALVTVVAFTANTQAKSLYVITDINAWPDTPINAYDIQGPPNYLVFQTTSYIPTRDGGAVGLDIDSNSGYLFATYEFSGFIDLIDGTTMERIDMIEAPNAQNLAGIAVDEGTNIVYSVDRYTDLLYAYDWDASSDPPTLTLKSGYPLSLPNSVGLFGIALDETNDLLYVADFYGDDYNGLVRYYDLATWTEQGNFSLSHAPIGIGIDIPNQLIYTVSGWGGSDLLSKYDLISETETTTDMGHGGMGVTVDPSTGLVYVTGGYDGDDVSVWDTTVAPFTQLHTTGNLGGDPTGLCIPSGDISYNPMNLTKTDDVAEDGCVPAGDQITYTICYDNSQNRNNVTNVMINDTLPVELIFVSASDGGIYHSGTHSVEWDIGTVQAQSGQSCVELIVEVDSSVPADTIVTNQATIDGDEIPPTTQMEETLVCEGSEEDTTPPTQTVELGTPIMEDIYDTGMELLDLIGSQTPVWINSTDAESGTDYIKYKLFKSDTFGEWNDPDWVFVYDNQQTGDPFTTDTDPTVGSISIEFYIMESCFHEIHAHCVDVAGYWNYSDPIDFLVDYDPPSNDEFYYIGSYVLPGGARYINDQTIKRIFANDTGCTGGVAGVDRIIWRIENGQTQTIASGVVYDDDPTVYEDVYVWVSGDLDMTPGKMMIEIKLKQECVHFIYHQAIDKLENAESGRKQLVYVDLTPPVINKTVGDPNCEVTPELEYCITNETPITFSAEDEGCLGGVGLASIMYRIWNMTDGWGQWITTDGETTIYIDEECTHYLEIKAEDHLQNIALDNETFHVDMQPPLIIKTVGDPSCGPEWEGPGSIPVDYVTYYPDGAEAYCVKTTTEIHLAAEDQGCCTSDITIEYKLWKADQAEPTSWTPFTTNFTFNEECKHFLLVRAYDCLEYGKENPLFWDLEIFYVDDTAPVIMKTVGDPNCTIIPGQEYCVSFDTPITIDVYNDGCCPDQMIYLRYTIDGIEWIDVLDWPISIYMEEECTHTLTIEAWDCLENMATDVETFHVDQSVPELIKTVGEPNCPLYMDCTMLNIPEETVNIQVQFIGDFAYFDTVVSNVPMGYDIINGPYKGWCVDQNNTISSGVLYDIEMWCSYDPFGPWPDDDWDMVNYILNHKHPDATIMEIQQAIWYFVNGGGIPPTQIGKSMVENATDYGEGFIPQEGEICAILCDTEDETQKIIIEYKVPENYCVTTNTTITLEAIDHPGCCQQDVTIEYKMWLANETMPSIWTLYTGPFSFDEECKHYLLVRIYDCLEHGKNDPTWDLEIFYVDDQAPVIMKTVGNPNCTIVPGEEYCITTKTPITIDTYNMGCCQDDNIELRYNINDGEWVYTDYPVTIYMMEECEHVLTIEARDCLGNTAIDIETFYVKDTPPGINKIVGEPHCGMYCEVPDYLPMSYDLYPSEPDKDDVTGYVVKSMDDQNVTFEIYISQSFTHTEFQLVLSEFMGNGCETLPKYSKVKIGWMPGESITEPLIGFNDGPTLHPTYGYWAGGNHTLLPDDIIVEGEIGDEYFKVIIPRTYFGLCGDKYYWAVNVGGTNSGSTIFSQYPMDWQKWKCCGPFEINLNGMQAYCVNLTTEITLEAIPAQSCCQSNLTIEYAILQIQGDIGPGYVVVNGINWQLYEGPFTFEEECEHYLLVRAYDCLENGKYDIHYWDIEKFYVDETPPAKPIKTVGDPKVKLEDDSHGHDQWMIFPETDICLFVNETGDPGCCPNQDVTLEYRIWYLGEWTDWMTYTECIHLTEGCVHYLEARAVDCLGNVGEIDNETFWVCGPSGDSGPDIAFMEPEFGETVCDRTLEVIIDASDDETAKEDLTVVMWIPGGRRDAPTLYYYPEYDPDTYGDEYFHAFIDIYKYQNGADLTLQAIAQDEDMNTEMTIPHQFTVCSTIVWDQWMQKGWNSLTLPFGAIGCNNTPEHVLASIIDHVEVIYWYDGSEWWDYVPSFEWNWPEFLTMQTGETYWIKIMKDDGLRYYTDTQAPMSLTIEYPIDEHTFECEMLDQDIWGTAFDIETGICSVHVTIQDNETGLYWNGTAWNGYIEHECTYDDVTHEWYCTGSQNIALTDGQEIIVTAKAMDMAGCIEETMIMFSYQCEPAEECVDTVTYTTTVDFNKGEINNIINENDELTLQTEGVSTYPLLWIANAGEASLSKWDTTQNKELARYHTWFGALGTNGSHSGPAPSRTCVDAFGNCYVANRHFDLDKPANVFKIFADDWIDRNSNGVLDTSYDANDDGTITPNEMLPFHDDNGDGIINDSEITDERVAWVATVGDPNGLGRSLAIDLNGDIWLGLYITSEYYKLDGDDGSILAGPIDVYPHTPYGALVDRDGYLWGSSLDDNLLKLNTNTQTVEDIYDHSDLGHWDYGIGIKYDEYGNTIIIQAARSGGTFYRFNASNETFTLPVDPIYHFDPYGIAIDLDGNVVVGHSSNGKMYKFYDNGTLIWEASAQISSEIRGTVVDSDNNIWAVHRGSHQMSKFGSDGSHLGIYNTGQYPYTYSDATGIGFMQSVSVGTWTVLHDSNASDTYWDYVSWNELVPENTSLTVKVRTSDDNVTWTSWHTVSNGISMTIANGRYIQVEVTMQSTSEETPVLYDLSIFGMCYSGEPL